MRCSGIGAWDNYPGLILAAERERRESQREAVLFLIMPLLTAFPSALLTARICAAEFSLFLDSIA